MLQSAATAMDGGRTGTHQYVSALRAHIKANTSNIPTVRPIFRDLALHETAHIHPKNDRQIRPQIQIWTAQTTFPLRNRFIADPQSLRYFFLRQTPFLTQLCNQFSDFFTIHTATSTPAIIFILTDAVAKNNLRSADKKRAVRLDSPLLSNHTAW